MDQSSEQKLNILCFGMGAIGSYIGGSLALAGENVTFLERSTPGDDFLQRGLRLRIGGEDHIIASPDVVTNLGEELEKKHFDVALLAVKAYDTAELVESLRPFTEKLPPVLCLQNGVENEELLASVLGKEKVIAGTVTSAIGRKGMGDIAVEKLRGMGLAAGHPISQRLFAAFQRAGLNPVLYSNPAAMKWSKMLTNLLANASAAILNMQPAEIFAHPALFALEMRQLREALNVMKAQAISVVDLPKTPVRLLAFVAQKLPLSIAKRLGGRILARGRGGKMPSLHLDLHNGIKKSEVDYLNGAVVRFGKQSGISTPVNQVLCRTLQQIIAGASNIEEYSHQPEKLLRLIEEHS